MMNNEILTKSRVELLVTAVFEDCQTDSEKWHLCQVLRAHDNDLEEIVRAAEQLADLVDETAVENRLGWHLNMVEKHRRMFQ